MRAFSSKSAYGSQHADNMAQAESFKLNFEELSNTLMQFYDKQQSERIKHNHANLKDVVKVAVLCGRHCTACSGHRKNIQDKNVNSGNFLAILKFLNQYNSEVQKRLLTPSVGRYLSPIIQNEIIDIIVYNMLKKDLISEIKEVKFFTILVEKVESNHHEQLPLCIRFVDRINNIHEKFLEFRLCQQITDEAIADKILRIIRKMCLEVKTVGIRDTIEPAIWHLSL